MLRTLLCRMGVLLAIAACPACSSPASLGALPRQEDNAHVVPLGSASASPSLVAAAPTVAQVPAAQVGELPAEEAPPAGIDVAADATALTKRYEADDFYFDYQETWAPDMLTADDAEYGIVLKHFSLYNYGALLAVSKPATGTLEDFMADYEEFVARNFKRKTRTTLGGVTGIQIEASKYQDGKELDQSLMGFLVDDRFVVVTVIVDPLSKDAEILKGELAVMLSSWTWRHASGA